MPLHYADAGSIDPFHLQGTPEDFLVFYSSVVDGKLWCPDCVAVDDIVQQTFNNADGPSALIVYVGDRAQWKTSKNVFRGEPWKVHSVPTIVKVRNGQEVARLVDPDIQLSLKGFVQEVTL